MSSNDSSFSESVNDLTAQIRARFPHSYSPRQRHRDYNDVFGTSAGRRVLYDLMERHGYHLSPVRNGDDDSDRLVFLRIGEANLIRFILFTMQDEPAKDPEPTAQTERETTDAR